MTVELYKSIRLISYGLFVLCSKKEGKFSNPQMIAVSIAKDNYTHEFVTHSKVFTASVLSEETPMKFIGRFGFRSGKNYDKFKDPIHCEIFITGVYDYSLGFLEAVVKDTVDCGTHTLFVAKVVGGKIIQDGIPLTYAHYKSHLKGKEPKNAPTYFGELEIPTD
ncbi:MAG: flavin reductase [Asgard group archaeon]|nr:flavin reductase [Asgard group archaeon]